MNKMDQTIYHKSLVEVTWLPKIWPEDWPTKCAIRWGEKELPVSKYITELLCFATTVEADSRHA